MSDDWRVTVTLRDDSDSERLQRLLAAPGEEIEAQVRPRLGDRVAVSRDGPRVFLYADTSAHAHEAEQVAKGIVAARDLSAEFAVDCWHPLEERWEDEAAALPRTDAERQAELERRNEDELAESERLGVALWEVRVELGSHHDAIELARRLDAESDAVLPGWTISVVRRWRYLIIGADNEEQANELARRLGDIAPPGSTIPSSPGPRPLPLQRSQTQNPVPIDPLLPLPDSKPPLRLFVRLS